MKVKKIIRKGRKDCKIYSTFEYVDSETGQGSIKVQEYDSDNIFVSVNKNGFYEDSECGETIKWRQFNLIDKDHEGDNFFSNWICRNLITFDLRKAKPINIDQKKLTIGSDKELKGCVLNAHIDFSIGSNPPDFVMALFDFNKPLQDWTSYYLKGSYFQFEI